MSDLLNTMGKKSNSVEGAGNASEPQKATASAGTSTGEHGRGDDLLAKLGGKKSQENSAETTATSSAESGQTPKSASSMEEPTGGQNSEWTDDSKMKEIKKLREENKAYRVKYQEQIDRLARENEVRLQKLQEDMQPLANAQKELERIKAEQEDKKRDLAERLAHREAKVAEIQAIAEAKEREYQKQLAEKDAKLSSFLADVEAQKQIYQNRIQEELSKIPETYQDLAKYIVKGAEDPREALTIIQEAKLRGMFEDKTVVVNHSVPGASDGARSSNERLKEAEMDRRMKMNSSQKIGEALKQIKSGTPNNVFRTK
jgi:DNA repair exonuclease SbcCD ATPase subunit